MYYVGKWSRLKESHLDKELNILTENNTFKTKDRVKVIGNIPNIDIIPGDVYSIKAVDERGWIKLNHDLGRKYDIFLNPKNFKGIKGLMYAI